MSFQLQAFDFGAAAALTQQLGPTGAFADVSFVTHNRLSHDGDGNLVITLAGAEPRKAKTQMLVIAGFGGSTFQEMKRSFYANAWVKGQENTPPDCRSETGVAPDAGVSKPQSATCKGCPQSVKGASRCSYRKSFIVFLLHPDADGNMVIDTSTPFEFQASSLSLFTELDKGTNSAGLMTMVQLLVKAKATIESVVLTAGFHTTSKAPTFTVAGQLPMDKTMEVIEAAGQPEVKALLAPRTQEAVVALPAPTRAPALSMDTPKAAAVQAMARPTRPAPPPEVVIPEAELYQAPVVAPAAPVESDDERDEREMMEALAAKKAMRAAAANKPAADKVIESTATVQTLPRAIAPPVTAAPAPVAAAPVAVTAPAGQRGAALGAFGAARKPG